MKIQVKYYNDIKKKVEEIEIEGSLVDIYVSFPYDSFEYVVEAKCPFDGSTLVFDLVLENELNKNTQELISEIKELGKKYISDDFDKEIEELIDNLILHYSDCPTETNNAGICIHFYPSEYDIRVTPEILEVEAGIAWVDVNEVVKEILKNKIRFVELEKYVKKLATLKDIEKLKKIMKKLEI